MSSHFMLAGKVSTSRDSLPVALEALKLPLLPALPLLLPPWCLPLPYRAANERDDRLEDVDDKAVEEEEEESCTAEVGRANVKSAR